MASGGTRTLRIVITGDGSGGIRAFESLDDAGRRASSSIDGSAGRAGGALAGLGAGAALAGRAAAAGIAGIAVGAGAAAVAAYKFGRAYEQNLNVLEAIQDPMSKTYLNTKQIQSALADSSGIINKYGYNLGEASGALVELNKAGRQGKEGLDALLPTLELARGGGIDLSNAATLVSNALNVFGKRAGTAGNVANVLANAANLSSASVADLGVSMQMSASVAAQAGLNIEEMGASLALLANNGLKGSDAGTSLKTMLLRLRTPVEKSKKALDELGVSTFDSSGKMKPLATIVDELNLAMADLSEEDKAQAMYRIFGSDAIRAGTILMKEGGNELRNFTLEVDKAGGAADMANARTQGLSGAIDRLKAAAQTAGERLFVMVSPTLGATLNSLMDKVGGFGEALSALAEGRVLIFAERMDQIFGGNGSLLKAFVLVGDTVVSMRDKIADAMDGAGNKASFFSEAGEKVRDIWATVRPVIEQFVGFVQSTLIPAFLDVLNKARPTFNQVKSTIITALEAVKVAFNVFVAVVKTVWGIFGGFILNTVKGFINGVMTAIKGGFQIIQGILNVFIGLFTGNWSKMWTGIKQVFSGAFDVIKGLFQAWLNFGLLSLLRNGMTSLLTAFKAGWDLLKAAPMAAWNFIRTSWSTLLNNLRSAGTSGMNAVTGVIRRAWTFIKEVFREGAERVVNQMLMLPDRIRAIFSRAGSLLTSAGREIVNGLIQGIRAMVDNAVEAARDLASRVKNAVSGALGIKSPSRVMAAFGKNIGQGLVIGMEGQARNVARAAAGLADAVTEPMGGGFDVNASTSLVGASTATVAGGRGSGSGASLNATVNITVNGSGDEGTGRQVADEVRKAMQELVSEMKAGRR